MSVIWNVTDVGAFIAGITGSALGLAASFVIYSTHFSDQVQVRDT